MILLLVSLACALGNNGHGLGGVILTTRGIESDRLPQFQQILRDAAAGEQLSIALVVTASRAPCSSAKDWLTSGGSSAPDTSAENGSASACSAQQEKVAESLRVLSALGARVDVVDAASDTIHEMKEKLRTAHCIYVLGGNTFYLWHHMRASGLDELIRQRVREGTLYVGCSAGSIVAGQSISTAFWKGWDDPAVVKADWSQPHAVRALGLVDASVFPHYASTWAGLVARRKGELDHTLITLEEEHGMYVSGVRMHGETASLLSRDQQHAAAHIPTIHSGQ